MIKSKTKTLRGKESPKSIVELVSGFMPKAPWLILLDIIGLLLTIILVIWQLGDLLQNSSVRVFVMLLLVFGVNTRFFLGQMKSIETLLHKTRLLILLAPTLAAFFTITVQAMARSYYSGKALLIYIAFWTIWLFLGRKVYYHYAPILNIMLIAPANFRSEFKNVDNLNLSILPFPPKDFSGWDIAVIDPSEQYSAEWLQWLSHADMYGIRTISAPLVIETLTNRIPLDMLHGRWAFEILRGESSYNAWKRIFDIVAVILASPFILLTAAIVAIAVKLDDGQPVLFWQERVGLNGKTFKMVKFRTMKIDSEVNGAAFAAEDDIRTTRIGPFLRKFRIDEIPQFWNVLKGDMSVIGPRPEQKQFAEQFSKEIPLYDLRHNIRPGITGWAQISQGYASDSDETREKLCYDFYYVKHFSLELDIRVIYHTVITVLTGFGSR